MRKFFVSMMMLTASIGANAQTAAEKIMNMMPKLPSLAEMIQWEKDYWYPSMIEDRVGDKVGPYVPFYEALKSAKEQAQESSRDMVESSVVNKALDSRVGNSKYTVRDFQNMSESEAEEAGKGIANDMLSGMGFSADDIAKMQSGKMSEADQMALASKMMKHKGLAGSSKVKVQGVNNEKGVMVLADTDRRIGEITKKMLARKTDAIEAGKELYDSKYADRIEAFDEKISPYVAAAESGTSSEVTAATAKIKELELQRYALYCEFFEKWLPTWRNAIVDAMNICRNELMPLMVERQMTTESLYQQTKKADYAEGAIYPIQAALTFLELPDDIGDYNDLIVNSSLERRTSANGQ